MFTKGSFNNRVAYESRFIKPSPGELIGSFVRLHPYVRLAAYAIPYGQAVSGSHAAKDYLQKEIDILRTKTLRRKLIFTCGMNL